MLRSFVGYYRSHLGLFILDLGAAFGLAGLDMLFPWASRYFINDLIPSGSYRGLVVFGVAFGLLYLVRFVLDYVVTYYGHLLGVRIEYDLRKELFTHIQKFSWGFFDDTKVGQLMSRIVNDLNEITEMAHHGPEDLFISGVMITGTFLVLLSIHVPLTLVTFALIPFMIWFTVRLNVGMRSNFRDLRKIIGDVNSRVEESLLGIRVVQSFVNEEYEGRKFDEGNVLFRDLRIRGFRLLGIYSGGVYWFASMLTLVSLTAGGYFLFQGAINLGDLVGYVLYMGIMVQPIRKLAAFAELYQRGMAGYHRFHEIMGLEPDIADAPGAWVLDRVRGDVRFEEVSFRYKEEGDFVLSGLNLEVSPGETVAIVGPSGVGKTTLCNLIPRFYELDEGRILIDGKSIGDVTLASLRENVGVVAQEVFLFSGTVGDNIAYGRIGDCTMEEVEAAARLAHIHDFILTLPDGYDTQVGERGIKLSGGQKQRISIARVFLKNPPILIFDEATSALDTKSERVIQESMAELSKGRTTFIIAHRLSTIRGAGRILVLTDEGIVESGRHEELMALGGVYASLYQAFLD